MRFRSKIFPDCRATIHNPKTGEQAYEMNSQILQSVADVVIIVILVYLAVVVNGLTKLVQTGEIKVAEDLSKLQQSADATVADEEKVLAKVQDLETQLAAAKAVPNNQAQIDAITAELETERAKIDAQP